jgi:D-alanyl-D-alanine carboxypeptidase
MTTLWPHQSMVKSYYGDPDPGHDGTPDRAWEDEHLTRIVPPYRMVLAWDTTSRLGTIRINRRCANSLLRVLTEISLHYGSEQALEANRLHLYGGAYAFRTMRGSTKLSMHSYGCAIDLDPEHNYLGRPYDEKLGMMPMDVVKMFESEGWEWGGNWKRPDCQHFQAAIT